MKNYYFITFLLFSFNLIAEVKLEDCASIQSDVKRLACYDYIVTGETSSSDELSQNEESSPKNNVSSNEATFGLSNQQKRENNINITKSQLTSSITKTTKTFAGKTRFRLSNDQLWESQSVLSSIKLNNFKAKNKITIEEATMGGFWMINQSSNVKIKVKRVS